MWFHALPCIVLYMIICLSGYGRQQSVGDGSNIDSEVWLHLKANIWALNLTGI